MGITSQVKNGGWGALFLYIHSLFVFLYWDVPLVTSDRLAIVAAAVPASIVMFAVVVLNHWLNYYWAGGHLKRSTEIIDQITGKRNFWHSASKETQETINDFDEKAYSHHISILSGIINAITVPITGYFVIGWQGIVVGLLISIILLRGLSVRSYRELNQLAKELSIPYEENYENQ
ncbi:hypothetical protein [Halobellus salinisoli]|uniref:hypothetical protein n=1 Tax=Halobellus salinisoli TaxID=3108500 RepID=UPI003009203E